MSKTAKDIISIFDQLKARRANLETLWQDESHYILPTKAFITRTRKK